MGPRAYLKGSLRARLIVGMAAMLLPLALLAIGTFALFQSLIGSFIEVTGETIEEIQPNNDIQKELLEARGALDDYLVAGTPNESRLYLHKAEGIDRAFIVFRKAPFSHAGEKAAVIQAEAHWRRAKAGSQIVLRSADPKRDPRARRAMEEIDASIGASVADLVKANDFDLQEIRSQLKVAKAGRQRGLVFVAAAFVLGISGAAFIGSVLGRSIMGPLSALGDGANRLGGGDLSFRVRLPRNDELGRLGEAFNMMAQRLEADQAALTDLATHDGLTGLYNARELFRILDEEIARSKRYDFSFSVLMIDIDHFKVVNDSHGHQAGDRVLRELAALMVDAVRPVDKVGRYGGEEFVVILPQTDGPGALAAAERVRRAVGDGPLSIGAGRSVKLTISLGVAVFPDDAREADDLIHQADIALYGAKGAGRNMSRRRASQK